jgi:hypothetical protein
MRGVKRATALYNWVEKGRRVERKVSLSPTPSYTYPTCPQFRSSESCNPAALILTLFFCTNTAYPFVMAPPKPPKSCSKAEKRKIADSIAKGIECDLLNEGQYCYMYTSIKNSVIALI